MALFCIAFIVPDIILNLSEKKRLLIEEIGNIYGTIYQLLDDYKDILFDARTKKNNQYTFKHWTITSTIWNQLDPQHFKEFVGSSSIELENSLRTKILDKLLEIVRLLLFKTKEKTLEINEESIKKCFALIEKEISKISPKSNY